MAIPDGSKGIFLLMLLFLWPTLSSVAKYCDSLFRGLSKYNLYKVPYIQNCAAWIASNTIGYSRITSVIKVLKTINLVYKFQA